MYYFVYLTCNNMKTQNSTTKTATIISALLIGFALLSPVALIPSAKATNGILSQDCIKNSLNAAQAMGLLLDELKARMLASSSNEFKTDTQGNTIQNGSVINSWTIGKSDCSLTWNGVEVFYFLTDAKGHQNTLVITLDPQLTKVTSVNEYKTIHANMGSSTFINWSGYEFAGNSNNSTDVDQAEGQWNVPQVSQPSTGGNCSTRICNLMIWDALEDRWGASDGLLAQTGSGSDVDCSTGTCNTSYYIWDEFLPGGVSKCSTNVSYGDGITAEVTNDVINSGSNTNYDISTVDGYSGAMCTVSSHYYNMPHPTLAPYINERECLSSCNPITTSSTLATLADFSSDTITGYVYYSGAQQFISTPYSNGYYVTDTMVNSGNTNISNGAVSSVYNDFTETYQNSSGT